MKLPPFELTADEIRSELAPIRSDISVAVCRAKNPFNIGAIIRVAHSFLVREIFLIGTEPYYEKASMGMHRYETIVNCKTDEEFLDAVKGRPLLGFERDHATTTLWQGGMPRDSVFLFGSEDDGIPEHLLSACTTVMAIPMYGINHSYPVAMTASMVLCEWARRRDPRGVSTPDDGQPRTLAGR